MLEDLRNTVDFFIRNNTKFSRKNFVEKNVELIERNRLENLYTEDVLKKSFEIRQIEQVRILDVGCKNWFYAKGEYSFFEKFCSNFFLDGIEIDAYRLYSNFYSRFEVAKYYTRCLRNVNYIAGNLLDLDKKYNYIIWFLPFVLLEPLKAWGLPKKYFCPKELLKHAYNLLDENGQMLIVNQGEKEFEVQKQLLEDLGVSYKNLGEIKSDFYEYKNKRFGVLIQK